jgi:protein-S-isoprenylcysteine O-methyltransferase Ste14
MYIGVLTLIGGWSLLAASPLLACYLLFFAAIFHLRVIRYEEPRLSKMFGAEWTDYCAITPRWLPKLGGNSHFPPAKPKG